MVDTGRLGVSPVGAGVASGVDSGVGVGWDVNSGVGVGMTVGVGVAAGPSVSVGVGVDKGSAMVGVAVGTGPEEGLGVGLGPRVARGRGVGVGVAGGSSTRCPAISFGTKSGRLATETDTLAPRLAAPVMGGMFQTLMPNTSPSMLTSGPPAWPRTLTHP